MAPSTETPKSERAARLRDTLARNRKVCQELKEAVENCIRVTCTEDSGQPPEGAQPPSG